MKNLKIFLALLLALTMVVSMTACGGNTAGKETDPKGTDAPAGNDDTAGGDDTTAAPGEDMSWLNLGGVYPIVDEGVEKTLTAVIPISDEYVDTYKEKWQYIMVNEVLNINLEVTPVPTSAWGERLPLILADVENLPDLLIGTGWATSELLRYGTQEGLLLDIAPYITEEYMPCLTGLFEAHPEYKTPWTDGEGHVYGINAINDTNRVDDYQWHYLNYQWMIDCGLDPATDMPETLDEFTDLMRKFKEVKSAEFGEEIYPISGQLTGWNSICRYLLAACGFVGANRKDGNPGSEFNLRNGEVTLPCADREGWEGFVKTLKTWYEEGLVHPEFITGEAAAMDALISAGKTGYCTVPLYVWIGNEATKDWWGAPLLTSDWCERPGVTSNSASNAAPSWHITTACEEVELALAFFDFFFAPLGDSHRTNAKMFSHGLCANDPLAEKYPQFICQKEDENGDHSFVDIDTEVYVDTTAMMSELIHLWGWGISSLENFDSNDAGADMDLSILTGYSDAIDAVNKYNGNGVQAWYDLPEEVRTNGTVFHYVPPMTFYNEYRIEPTEELPAVVYLDAETQERADDLKVTIREYALTETAKFIVGDRPIEELPDYFDEMDALGAQDYIKIHQDYFDAVVGG